MLAAVVLHIAETQGEIYAAMNALAHGKRHGAFVINLVALNAHMNDFLAVYLPGVAALTALLREKQGAVQSEFAAAVAHHARCDARVKFGCVAVCVI